MELTTKSLENVLKVVEKHNQEATIDIQKNKLVIRGVSTGNTTMWDFVCGIPEQTKTDRFAIKIKELLGALRGTSQVELTTDDANLIIKTKKRTVKLRMIDSSEVDQEFPSPVLKAKMVFDWNDFKDSLAAIKAISDENEPSIWLTSGDELKITSQSDLSDFEEIITVKNQGESGKFAKYGLSLLENFTHLKGKVTVSFDDNYPLLIEQAEDDWFFKAIVAPRVDNN